MSTGEMLTQEGCLEQGSHGNWAVGMSGQKDCGEYGQSLDTELGALSGHWTYQVPDDSRTDPTVPYIRTAITSTIPRSGDHFLKVDQLP